MNTKSLVDEEIRTIHPSYGVIGFSCMQGNPGRLFGSPLARHDNWICLRIQSGERIHSLGYDKFYGHHRASLIEVYLSSAQFAELITTMNMGDGVPCTIKRLNGERVESPPEEPTEQEHVRLGFEKRMEDFSQKLSTQRDEVTDLCSKKNLTQQDRKQILSVVNQMVAEFRSNIPFVLEQFGEATEKVVQHAKTEIDAFLTTCAMAEGFKSLAQKASEPDVPVLDAHAEVTAPDKP